MPSGPVEVVSYTVTNAVDTIRINYEGSPIQGDTIYYNATNGYNGQVWLPRPDSTNKAKVLAAVDADLKKVIAAQSITGIVRR